MYHSRIEVGDINIVNKHSGSVLFKNFIMSHTARQLYACLFADCQPPMIRSVIKRTLSKLKFQAACCISNEFHTWFQHWKCCLLKIRAV